jgi:hypothetical protein
MSVGWTDIAFIPDDELAAEIVAAWQWLLPGSWSPFLCSMIGGIFLEEASGIYWLESGTGLVERIAVGKAQFESTLKSNPECVEEWFLPPLVTRLHDAGKRPNAGECYAFTVLPVFAEGRYEIGNMFVAPVREPLVALASIHKQLSDIPDGGEVLIKIVG